MAAGSQLCFWTFLINDLPPWALPGMEVTKGPNVYVCVGRSSAMSCVEFTPSVIVPVQAVVGMSALLLLIHHCMTPV